jgi:hypothetical protein
LSSAEDVIFDIFSDVIVSTEDPSGNSLGILSFLALGFVGCACVGNAVAGLGNIGGGCDGGALEHLSLEVVGGLHTSTESWQGGVGAVAPVEAGLFNLEAGDCGGFGFGIIASDLGNLGELGELGLQGGFSINCSTEESEEDDDLGFHLICSNLISSNAGDPFKRSPVTKFSNQAKSAY